MNVEKALGKTDRQKRGEEGIETNRTAESGELIKMKTANQIDNSRLEENQV